MQGSDYQTSDWGLVMVGRARNSRGTVFPPILVVFSKKFLLCFPLGMGCDQASLA